MLKFTITKDLRCFKVGQEVSIDLDKIQFIPVVGNNGCGKSTLFQALRAKFPRKKEINIGAGDLKKLLDHIEIETDYKTVHFLDQVFDNGESMNNAYDACSFIDSGGFATRTSSHGEKSLNRLVVFLDQLPITTEKSLVVFDEMDTGFDLRFQKAQVNLIMKLNQKGYHVITITHNIVMMLRSAIVFDLEAALSGLKGTKASTQYLEEKIQLSKLIKESQ